MDYYLKFADEAEARSVLYTDDTPNFPGHATDVIGVIYQPTGIMLDEVPEMAAIPGWHVNMRGPEDETLAAYHIDVVTPFRVWA